MVGVTMSYMTMTIDLPFFPDPDGDETWREHSACTRSSMVEFFDLSNKESAKKLCDMCVVRGECLRFALHNNLPNGIWGGATPNERKEMRRTRRTVLV